MTPEEVMSMLKNRMIQEIATWNDFEVITFSSTSIGFTITGRIATSGTPHTYTIDMTDTDAA